MNDFTVISADGQEVEAREEAAFAKAAKADEQTEADKTFFDWVGIGEGLAALRDRAMRQSCSSSPSGTGYTQRYAALKAKHAWADHYDPITIYHALWLYENRTDVKRWRATWSNKQRREWVLPKVIHQKYEMAHVAAPPPMQRKAAKRQAEGSLFDLAHDAAPAIASVIYGNVSEAKAAAIHAALGELIKGGRSQAVSTASENPGS